MLIASGLSEAACVGLFGERVRPLVTFIALGGLVTSPFIARATGGRDYLARLNEIDALDPRHGEFVTLKRQLAAVFQFDAMREILRNSMEDTRGP